MVSTASLLGVRHLGEVVENKRQVRLLCPWAKFTRLFMALDGTPPPLCGRQVDQFLLRIEGWWQEEHPTVQQMPCYKNADTCCGDP